MAIDLKKVAQWFVGSVTGADFAFVTRVLDRDAYDVHMHYRVDDCWVRKRFDGPLVKRCCCPDLREKEIGNWLKSPPWPQDDDILAWASMSLAALDELPSSVAPVPLDAEETPSLASHLRDDLIRHSSDVVFRDLGEARRYNESVSVNLGGPELTSTQIVLRHENDFRGGQLLVEPVCRCNLFLGHDPGCEWKRWKQLREGQCSNG